jgi:hypothetical protein
MGPNQLQMASTINIIDKHQSKNDICDVMFNIFFIIIFLVV